MTLHMMGLWRLSGQLAIAWSLGLLASYSDIAFARPERTLQVLPFEVVADITWQGKDIRIRRVLTCAMRERVHPFIWDQDETRIAHVLPNGETLVIVVPPVCEGLNNPPRSTAISQLPLDYLPFVYWLNDAREPTEAELIVSVHYFKNNPRRRFEFQRFFVRLALDQQPDNLEPDVRRLVNLIDSSLVAFERYFVAVPIVVIPEAVWNRFPSLRSLLAAKATSFHVDLKTIRESASPLLQTCVHRSQGIGDRPCGLRFDDRPLVVGGSRETNVWAATRGDVGVIRFSPLAEVREVDTTGCNPAERACNLRKGQFTLKVFGSTLSSPKQGEFFFYFDSAERTLVRYRYTLSRSSLYKGSQK